MKMAFSGLTLILLRITYTNCPTVRSAGTRYLKKMTEASASKSQKEAEARRNPSEGISHSNVLFLVYVGNVALLGLLDNYLGSDRKYIRKSTTFSTHSAKLKTSWLRQLLAWVSYWNSVRVLVADASCLSLSLLCGAISASYFQTKLSLPDTTRTCLPTTDMPSSPQKTGRSPSGCSSLKDFGRAAIWILLDAVLRVLMSQRSLSSCGACTRTPSPGHKPAMAHGARYESTGTLTMSDKPRTGCLGKCESQVCVGSVSC